MIQSNLILCAGSFRDSSGQVYTAENQVLRTIEKNYAIHWEHAISSGFLDEAVEQKLLLEFTEIVPIKKAWKSISSPLLPFVSYPYEWCFGQLQDAALHTLDLLDLALAHDMVLKDATAYNIQFMGASPIFIDHLSFEICKPGAPWEAYLQFCRHFLAPLALMAKSSIDCGRMLFSWVEGLPLDLTARLLPYFTKFTPSLGIHIHMHAKMQQKYSDARTAAKKVKEVNLSKESLHKLSQSLRLAIEGLKLSQTLSTEWGDYYSDTNYTQNAAHDKRTYLEKIATDYGADELAIDLGANEGVYSRFLANHFKHVLAADIDYIAVEKMYKHLKQENNAKVTPLVIDLGNPSPGIGWGHTERINFAQRCQVKYLSALALIHHLVFTSGIPLSMVSEYFAYLLKKDGICILEFVPMVDSQVQRLLAARKNTTNFEYTIEACQDAFAKNFMLLETHKIVESKRTLLVFQKS